MGFDCITRTHVGLRRKVNEDSVLDRTDRGLWAVADGMGGHEAGDVASAMVTEALRQLPIIYGLDQTVDGAIAAIQNVNRELIAMAGTEDRSRTIGTTIVGLAVADGHFRCFWAGDSRAYRVRDGQIRRLSRDHSLVQDLVDAGMLKSEEAERHENANIITRAVGVSEELQVDSSAGEAAPGDLFLLGSDGLTRLVDDGELLEQLATNPLEQAGDALIDMVLARGAPDNVSLVIVKLH
jgi:serine/threonine protein phosphatase PrpC